jgi:hypothetical protein
MGWGAAKLIREIFHLRPTIPTKRTDGPSLVQIDSEFTACAEERRLLIRWIEHDIRNPEYFRQRVGAAAKKWKASTQGIASPG